MGIGKGTFHIVIILPLLFSANVAGRSSIGTMNQDGSDQALIHSCEEGAGEAKWSEDMSMIVFSSSNTSNGKNEIFLMNSDGFDVQQLTSLTQKHGQSKPRFSGSNKIWWTWHGPGNGYSELYRMNRDGSGKTRLTHFRDQGKQAGLFDFGGSRVFYYKQNNSWSPTGEVYSADLSLNNEVQLTHNSASDGLSDVSSDGMRVLFSRAEASNGYGPPSNIYIINADGSREVRLTSVSGSEYCGSAIFSPDRSRIVYYYHDGSQSDIWIMNSDGSSKANITNTPQYNENPTDWRNGKILFTSTAPVSAFRTMKSRKKESRRQHYPPQYVREMEELNSTYLEQLSEWGYESVANELPAYFVSQAALHLGVGIPAPICVLTTAVGLWELDQRVRKLSTAFLWNYLNIERQYDWPQVRDMVNNDESSLEGIKAVSNDLNSIFDRVFDEMHERPTLFALLSTFHLGPLRQIPEISEPLSEIDDVLGRRGGSLKDLQLVNERVRKNVTSNEQVNYCPHCGTKVNEESARFCSQCGKSLR